MEGELNRSDDGYEARFERVLSHPVEKVWGALSEQEHLEAWLNVVEFEGKAGGDFVTEHGEGEFAEDRILRIEAPHLLEHTWWEEVNPEGIVRWELEPHPDGCLLTLTYTAPVESSDDWARDMAGWHTMVELLASYLDGVPASQHQRPTIDADGGRSGGAGAYADFEEHYETYADLIDKDS